MASFRGRVVTFLAVLFAVLFVGAINQARAGSIATPNSAGTVRIATVRTDAWLSAEVDYLGGRKLTVVCATTAQDWAQALAEAGLPSGKADEYYGFSLIRQGEMHLSPYVCEGLRLGVRASARTTDDLQVAWAVDVLLHESVHLARSTFDEGLTEACARAGLPLELHRLYGIAYHSAEMKRLAAAATWFRRTQAPEYQGGTCSPVAA